MEKINGREAITALAEYDCAKRKLTPVEYSYVLKQVKSFKDFLIKDKGLDEQEAQESIQRLYDKDVKSLTADTFDEFYWSRQDQVGDMEIDMATAIDRDFEGQSDNECYTHNFYWTHMERIANKAIEKPFFAERYNRSKQNFERLNELIDKIESIQDKSRSKTILFSIKSKVNQMRFGITEYKGKVKYTKGGGELEYRHWALCFNRVNALLDNPKRIQLKTFDDPEPEYEDAMDSSGLYYIYDPERLPNV